MSFKKLDHPNVLKYYETYYDEWCIYLIMEYIPGQHLLSGKKKHLNEK